MKEIKELLKEVRDILLLQTKDVFTLNEFCTYTGFSKPYAYYLVSKRVLPFYKPLGKTIFFKKEDVFDFMTSNAVMDKTSKQKKVS